MNGPEIRVTLMAARNREFSIVGKPLATMDAFGVGRSHRSGVFSDRKSSDGQTGPSTAIVRIEVAPHAFQCRFGDMVFHALRISHGICFWNTQGK